MGDLHLATTPRNLESPAANSFSHNYSGAVGTMVLPAPTPRENTTNVSVMNLIGTNRGGTSSDGKGVEEAMLGGLEELVSGVVSSQRISSLDEEMFSPVSSMMLSDDGNRVHCLSIHSIRDYFQDN